MKAVLIMLGIDGVALGFVSSMILHLIPSTGNLNHDHSRAGVLQIFMGTGACIGGFFSGFLTDKFRTRLVGYFSLTLMVSACLLTILVDRLHSYEMSCFCGFWWGIALFFLEGWILVACSRVYGGLP